MKTHQKRSVALILAVLSIALSTVFWSQIFKNFVPPTANVIPAGELENEQRTASGGAIAAPRLQGHNVSSRPLSPLMPSMHFAASATSASTGRGSAASRADDRQMRDELQQWEIREAYSLSIPSLTIRAPAFMPSRRYWDAHDWETLERQMQVGLLYGVVAYPNAVAPDDRGSIVIAGHSSPPNDRARDSSFGTVFATLPDIEIGERIVLRTSRATVQYTVVETMIVPAGDTSILLSQQGESVLKLITCYPVGSTKDRFVVIAKKVAL
ncbi:hypothetical protein AUJ46_04505 [Candidatus Peregrinibacteria bacterium CG1_02_54_53]|nr:MAG: hypothetical protein AUJ46_04505 [Candidatus Peregrinibacteria bacterium CG1_02_54_53]